MSPDNASITSAINGLLAAEPPLGVEAVGSPASDTVINELPPPPPEPTSLALAGVSEGEAEALALKTLLQMGPSSGSRIATHICLPRRIVDELLGRLRDELLIAIKSSAGIQDYKYQLTDAGFSRARQHAEQCNYSGAAPVPLAAYTQAIARQSLQQASLPLAKLSESLNDLTLASDFVSQIAQAINDGRGMFLYGSPGNGKTTLAERICDAFGQHIWIPKMVGVDGDLLRLFDPSCHTQTDAPQHDHLAYDRRWVLIRRPTVVVGGELTLDQLDASYEKASGISEAPVQMKANGGALLIDDFGRQRVSSTEILNRLIVPLEKQFDYLSLASGRQVRTPFDLLFILSTNLEPKQLVDEAFLRRIAYKIEVRDPSEEQFRSIFHAQAEKIGYKLTSDTLDSFIDENYTQAKRPLRFCQPRDLLRQVKNYCEVHELPPVVTPDALSVAVQNYFAGL